MKKALNIGMIGTQFMGRAHSNAFHTAPLFFDLPLAPVRHTACGRNPDNLALFANQFGWLHRETSWEKLVADKALDLIDICAPNDLHMPVALAAAREGKHILCEKPMARNVEEAWRMYEAVRNTEIVHMMVFNYRFVPAILLARQVITEGKIGVVRHFNAVYYQDWLIDPKFPMVWRHDAEVSGSGAHGDMNAHIVDLARFLVDEIDEVNGIQKTFITERPTADGKGTGKVTADDATVFLATFRNGAIGSFTGTRLAPGKKNFLRLEIFGSEGSLLFNLERINELCLFLNDDNPGLNGYKTILVTESSHPYLSAWWPPGHALGWEHTFVHVVKEIVEAISGKKSDLPSFYDGFRCQQVLDAVVTSANRGSWVAITDTN